MAFNTGGMEPYLLKLKQFLVESGKLDEPDASIYILGLNMGVITSRDVINEMSGITQSTAGEHLNKLANEGYFKRTPSEGSDYKGGRGHVIKYAVIAPKLKLKELFGLYDEIKANIGRIDEHLEVLADNKTETGEDIWIIKPFKIALQEICKYIRGASISIKIYSHDCHWFEDSELMKSIKTVLDKKIPVEIITNSIKKNMAGEMRNMGVKLKRTRTRHVSFCLIDDSLLLLPLKTEKLSNQYIALALSNRHFIADCSDFFREISNKRRR